MAAALITVKIMSQEASIRRALFRSLCALYFICFLFQAWLSWNAICARWPAVDLFSWGMLVYAGWNCFFWTFLWLQIRIGFWLFLEAPPATPASDLEVQTA